MTWSMDLALAEGRAARATSALQLARAVVDDEGLRSRERRRREDPDPSRTSESPQVPLPDAALYFLETAAEELKGALSECQALRNSVAAGRTDRP